MNTKNDERININLILTKKEINNIIDLLGAMSIEQTYDLIDKVGIVKEDDKIKKIEIDNSLDILVEQLYNYK